MANTFKQKRLNSAVSGYLSLGTLAISRDKNKIYN